ncbi:class I SAM-dependent methyltransferase [Paenibacillus sp. GD4]|jgi:predicted O-methyltransferase YrrM|uniref:class I SAM-dependent methyltransferase n=1 Tax=Paenibacillus sp. GD4 TaxID=3068890 RepID=UPI002796D045|nr:class I SAM-dependent methyltransferase [Paenibacillus sp. GD4]MDQ1912297.1 class I SAM-dependent methyltransferase [Paenibacillus sp. GD4]
MSKKIMKIIEHVRTIEGWLTNKEILGLVIMTMLAERIPGSIVEIGSYKGKSTLALAMSSLRLTKAKKTVYAIDPFSSNGIIGKNYYKAFRKNMKNAGVKQYVVPIKRLSHEAYNDFPVPIAQLFIDGNHEYDMVKQDISIYVPKVSQGGYIAFHDYNQSKFPGVKHAVDELLQNKKYQVIGDFDSLRIVMKSNI